MYRVFRVRIFNTKICCCKVTSAGWIVICVNSLINGLVGLLMPPSVIVGRGGMLIDGSGFRWSVRPLSDVYFMEHKYSLREWALPKMFSRSEVKAQGHVCENRCGTVCLNSFSNRTSPSDNSNDR